MAASLLPLRDCRARSPGSSAGEIDYESAAGREPGLSPAAPEVQLDDGPRDRQPESGAAVAGCSGRVGPVAPVEDPVEIAGRNAIPLVAVLDLHAAGRRRAAHLHGGTGRAVP